MMAGSVRQSRVPVLFISPCWTCDGVGCESCNGGQRHESCATSTEVQKYDYAFVAYRAYAEHSVLPWSGGFFEQTEPFVRVARLISGVIAHARSEGS